jgi:3-isopropylmalate dehydratase small subunit
MISSSRRVFLIRRSFPVGEEHQRAARDVITVDFASGEITTPTQKLSFPPLPQFVMGILEDGGLIQHVKKSLKHN